MRRLMLAVTLALLALPSFAQGWGNLDRLILPNLSRSGTSEVNFWLPNTNDPATAGIALAIVYEYIEGSAGSTSLASGFFVRQADSWVFTGPVSGLFGQSPRDAVFGETSVELTTTMLGPNEPRCCPTVPARWRIDYQSRQAERLN